MINPHDISVDAHYKQLTKLIIEANEVAGWWDGDNSGRNEDLAHQANDIIKAAEKLQTLLDEYSDL